MYGKKWSFEQFICCQIFYSKIELKNSNDKANIGNWSVQCSMFSVHALYYCRSILSPFHKCQQLLNCIARTLYAYIKCTLLLGNYYSNAVRYVLLFLYFIHHNVCSSEWNRTKRDEILVKIFEKNNYQTINITLLFWTGQMIKRKTERKKKWFNEWHI